MQIDHIFSQFGLSDDELATWSSRFETVAYQPKQHVVRRGDDADAFYCVLSGELAVSVDDDRGNERVIRLLGPGQFFGEIGLLQASPRTANVRALTHARVYRLDADGFQGLLEKSPAFAQFIDRLRLKRQFEQIPAFSTLSDEDLTRVVMLQESIKVGAGTVLAQQGKTADRLYVIANGRARLVRREVDDSETPIGELLPGEHYGDEAFFLGKSNTVELVMAEDGEVMVIERKALLRLASHTPTLAAEIPLRRNPLRALLPYILDKSAYLHIATASMNRPRAVLWSMLASTLLLMVIAATPSIWPAQFPWLNALKVDTDPENMLPADDDARVVHNSLKKEMNLYDVMVVGIVNETHPDGIYNPSSLQRVHQLAEFAASLRWRDDEGEHGVVSVDMMAPSTVDDVGNDGPGTITFSWLMPQPPPDRTAALELRERIKRLPLMNASLASVDDRAIAIYLPLTAKDVSYRVYKALQDHIEEFHGDDRFYISGLPVAEDSFGVEMFIQMAISAPLAMAVIFALLYYFFRNLTLIYAPMIVAMVSVMVTMSLLVVTGQTVHIMSSMIPIFIMPIAVLDSVHILSEFFDYYPRIRSRRLTMEHVMRELFVPMLYTSMTTAIGFASLALVPIPPVQVFGIFVAFGVLLAWLLSISFIPAYIFLVRREKIEVLAGTRSHPGNGETQGIAGVLQILRMFSLRHARKIVVLSMTLAAAFVFGITQIIVNDNPIRWFQDDHPISVADRELNKHFAGTYMAYLAFKGVEPGTEELHTEWQAQLAELRGRYPDAALPPGTFALDPATNTRYGSLLDAIERNVDQAFDADGLTEAGEFLLEDALEWLDVRRVEYQLFKQPAMLNYLAGLQDHLLTTGIVGKSVTLTDFVKTVNRELRGGDETHYRVPDSPPAVAQALLTYQNSHRPQDLWRFVTSDYRQGIVWLMLKSGDNVDMSAVVDAVETYLADNPVPFSVDTRWFGLNYVNVVWQEQMVNGMIFSIFGSYLAVALIMTLLLRSVGWALLAMLPLTVTMLVIYGVLGLAGKAYDMPVAVLSALAIGLAVDFAIHLTVRMRRLYSESRDWQQALVVFFDAPARAIVRNLLIVAIGFLPLLLAPLVPYNTVGNLIAAILFVSGCVTLLLIPAIFKLAARWLFSDRDRRRTTLFGTYEAIFLGVVATTLVAVVFHPTYPVDGPLMPVYLIVGALVGYRLWLARSKTAN
jgi:predicted RND superfamily exporter protein/CRP-like cAMP-binding protein